MTVGIRRLIVRESKVWIDVGDFPALIEALAQVPLGPWTCRAEAVRAEDVSVAVPLAAGVYGDRVRRMLIGWRWAPIFDPVVGRIVDLRFLGTFVGADQRLFEALAPSVREAGWIEAHDGAGEVWCWRFDDYGSLLVRRAQGEGEDRVWAEAPPVECPDVPDGLPDDLSVIPLLPTAGAVWVPPASAPGRGGEEVQRRPSPLLPQPGEEGAELTCSTHGAPVLALDFGAPGSGTIGLRCTSGDPCFLTAVVGGPLAEAAYRGRAL